MNLLEEMKDDYVFALIIHMMNTNKKSILFQIYFPKRNAKTKGR